MTNTTSAASNTVALDITLGFIGGGNMAQAIISGLLNTGFSASNIMVSDPVESIRTMLAEKGVQTTTDNHELVKKCNTVVLAIKPQLFEQVLSPLKGSFSTHLVISIAAGVTVNSITNLLGHGNIVRAMPNTPALLGEGATGLYVPACVSESHARVATAILQATGLVVTVDTEEKLHAVTAVSGSAPAYFFYVMEAMVQAGVQQGLTQEQATQLTLQTAFGSAKMALQSSDTPTVLREKVTSPNGTTHAAIENMKANGVNIKIAEAMSACVARSVEMAENM